MSGLLLIYSKAPTIDQYRVGSCLYVDPCFKMPVSIEKKIKKIQSTFLWGLGL